MKKLRFLAGNPLKYADFPVIPQVRRDRTLKKQRFLAFLGVF